MAIFEKAKGFLSDPSNAFESSKYDTLEEALKYYLIIAAIYSALLAAMTALFSAIVGPMVSGFLMMPGTGVADIISNFILFLILMIIGAFVWGAILHVFLYALGERKEIPRTIKAVMYGSTPLALLGWIPLLGIIGWVWSWVLEIIGIKQYHEITTGKAIATVLIPIIIFFVLALVIIALISSFVMSMIKSP